MKTQNPILDSLFAGIESDMQVKICGFFGFTVIQIYGVVGMDVSW